MFGFIDSAFHAKDYHHNLHDVFGASPVSSQKMLTDFVMTDRDQQTTNACTSFGVSQVIWINQGTFGVPIEKRVYPAEMAGYYWARCRKWGWEKVFDVGSSLHDLWEELRLHGLIRLEKLPFNAFNIDKPPKKKLYRDAADLDWLKYRWVLDPPGQRERTIRQTIDNYRSLTMAVEVDDPFLQWKLSDGPWKRRKGRLGSHMVSIFGHEKRGVWCANSYSKDYGEGGFILIDWSQVESAESRGFSTAEFDMDKLNDILETT